MSTELSTTTTRATATSWIMCTSKVPTRSGNQPNRARKRKSPGAALRGSSTFVRVLRPVDEAPTDQAGEGEEAATEDRDGRVRTGAGQVGGRHREGSGEGAGRA